MSDKKPIKKPVVTIQIDAKNLPVLAETGGKLVFEAKAEDAIYDLLRLEEAVKQAILYVKDRIEEAGLSVNPNFTSVQGDKIKAGYRSYGAKYRLDNSLVDKVPSGLVEEVVRTTYQLAPAKVIDDWRAEHDGKLPLGIDEIERPKQISIKPIAEFNNGDED